MKTDTIEKNGPANIVSFIRVFRMSYQGIDVAVLDTFRKIEEQCWATMSYMDKLSNPDDVRWSDFKPKEQQPNP